jgi:hypothetical protein
MIPNPPTVRAAFLRIFGFDADEINSGIEQSSLGPVFTVRAKWKGERSALCVIDHQVAKLSYRGQFETIMHEVEHTMRNWKNDSLP